MEWTIVTVLIAIVGFVIAVSTPLIKNTRAMTELTVILSTVSEQIKKMEMENAAEHKDFQEQLDEHDDKIADHETRLTVIEKTGHHLAEQKTH